MAWHDPSIHRVTNVTAATTLFEANDASPAFTNVKLTFEQVDGLGRKDKATLDVFLPIALADYAHALAEAINSAAQLGVGIGRAA